MSKEQDVKISINIPSEMYKWLEKHKEINRSELFRNVVESKRNMVVEKISEVFILNAVVIIAAAVGFILLLFAPVVSYLFILTSCVILTSIVILSTVSVIVRKVRKVNGTKKV